MKHEPAANRSLRRHNPMLWPRDPTGKHSEAYLLGCDARNDGLPFSDNPYGGMSADPVEWGDWREGWRDTDRERKADDEGGD